MAADRGNDLANIKIHASRWYSGAC